MWGESVGDGRGGDRCGRGRATGGVGDVYGGVELNFHVQFSLDFIFSRSLFFFLFLYDIRSTVTDVCMRCRCTKRVVL